MLRVQGNLDGAAALARKAIELEPLEGWCYRELGQIEMAQGRYKEALESFTTAKTADRGNQPLCRPKPCLWIAGK